MSNFISKFGNWSQVYESSANIGLHVCIYTFLYIYQVKFNTSCILTLSDFYMINSATLGFRTADHVFGILQPKLARLSALFTSV